MECLCFDVGMVSIFAAFAVPDGFAWPLCVCVGTCSCACTRVLTCTAHCVSFSWFLGCARVHLCLCVCCPCLGTAAGPWPGLSRGSMCRCGAGAGCVRWAQGALPCPALPVLGLLYGRPVQTPRLPPSAERGKMEKVPHGARRFFFINKGIWGQLEHE